MAGWVYADDCDICALQEEADRLTLEQKRLAEKEEVKYTVWTLCVKYTGILGCNEYLAVTGSCEPLGNWKPNDMRIMRRERDNKHCVNVKVPRGSEFSYRYVVCAWNALTDHYTLVQWETHPSPRTIQERKKKVEQFGWQLSDYNVGAPWVRSGESMVHFHVFNAPFYWPKGVKQNLIMYMKLVPMCATEIDDFVADESLAKPSSKIKPNSIKVNVKNLAKMRNEIYDQQEYGARCGPKDLIVFDMIIMDSSLTIYRFDVYTCGSCDIETAKTTPCFYGYGYVEPHELIESDGIIKLTINAPETGKRRCCVKLRYQLILPMHNRNFTLERTFINCWSDQRIGQLVGHRGSGVSHVVGDDFVRENTMFSFRRAAKNGMNVVELDVLLTRDGKPVVFHDHVLFMLAKPEPFTDTLKERDVFVLPAELFNEQELVKRASKIENGVMIFAFDSFTADELRRFKAYRFCQSERKISCEQMETEQMPFPLLEHVLTQLDPAVSCVIEVKYVQKDSDQAWEFFGFKPKFERNEYVDKILEVVLKHGGKRRIMLTSFDCATCLSLRYKQKLYPVMLLTRDPFGAIQYADPRVNEFQNAVFTCKAMDLAGIVLHTHTILNDPQTVRCVNGLGMLAMCYGEANNDDDNRTRLQRFGVNGIIFDAMGELGGKQTRPTLLKLETGENKDYLACVQKVELLKKCGF